MSADETDCCAPTRCCAGCCCQKCCCNMPHGRIVLLPTLTLTIASILSMITLCQCMFVVPDVSSYSYYGAGFWPYCVYSPYYGSSYQQMSYYVHQEDPMRKIAMSVGLFATIAGVGAMSGLWPITCKPYGPAGKWTVFTIVLIVFLSQLATLTMFGTEYCTIYSCTLGWGGIMSMVAAGLWLIAAVGIAFIPKATPKPSREEEIQQIREAIRGEEGLPAGTVITTETMMSDGTKIFEKVTTHSDGSKTIEKTVVRPEEHAVKAEAVGIVETAEGP